MPDSNVFDGASGPVMGPPMGGVTTSGSGSNMKQTFAALGARLPETWVSASNPRRRMISRVPLALAGKFKRIRFQFDNWTFNANGEFSACPTTLTAGKMAMEFNGQDVPIVVSSNRSPVFPSGVAGVSSDWIDASAFGLPYFETPRYETTDHGYTIYEGVRFFFRGDVTVPDFTGVFPIGAMVADADGEGFCALYDPNNHIDQVDATGPMATPTGAVTVLDFTAAGTGGNTFGWGPSAVIGETLDDHQLVVVVQGSSSPSGYLDARDPNDMVVGRGGVDRSLQAADNSLDYAIPACHATRASSYLAGMATNAEVVKLFKYANHYYVYPGGNGLGEGYTPAQETNTLTAFIAQARSQGVKKVAVGLNTPGNDSTDNFTTFAGLSYSSTSTGVGDTTDELKNREARASVDGTGRIDLILPSSNVRAPSNNRKWLTDEVTPFYSTADGTHRSPSLGYPRQGDETRWAWRNGLALPLYSRQFAAGCFPVLPSSDTLARVEALMAAAAAAGVTWHAMWGLKLPILQADEYGYRTRRLSILKPGIWDLGASGAMTYASDGTKGNGSTYFATFIKPSADFGTTLSPVAISSMTFVVKVVDRPDDNPIMGSASDTAANKTLLFQPRSSSGNLLMRLNDVTNYQKPVASGIGTFVGTRNGNRREVWQNKTSLGADASDVAPTDLSPAFIRLLGSTDPAQLTSSKVSFAAFSHGWTSAQALAMTDAVDVFCA